MNPLYQCNSIQRQLPPGVSSRLQQGQLLPLLLDYFQQDQATHNLIEKVLTLQETCEKKVQDKDHEIQKLIQSWMSWMQTPFPHSGEVEQWREELNEKKLFQFFCQYFISKMLQPLENLEACKKSIQWLFQISSLFFSIPIINAEKIKVLEVLNKEFTFRSLNYLSKYDLCLGQCVQFLQPFGAPFVPLSNTNISSSFYFTVTDPQITLAIINYWFLCFARDRDEILVPFPDLNFESFPSSVLQAHQEFCQHILTPYFDLDMNAPQLKVIRLIQKDGSFVDLMRPSRLCPFYGQISYPFAWYPGKMMFETAHSHTEKSSEMTFFVMMFSIDLEPLLQMFDTTGIAKLKSI